MTISIETKLPEAYIQNRLLSARQAMEFLGIGKASLYRYLRNKKDPMPSIKLGRFRKFQLDKLTWWVEKHQA